jgi:hypothetical protein
MSENELLVIADAHIAEESMRVSMEDVAMICQSTSFEGTLTNHYMRECFQSFLQAEHSDELFLFWQHAEDFRLNHPSSPKRSQTTSANDGVQDWAERIYAAFISHDAQHQVSVSAEDIQFIERSLKRPPFDMFVNPQRAAYTQLRASSFARFVQVNDRIQTYVNYASSIVTLIL